MNYLAGLHPLLQSETGVGRAFLPIEGHDVALIRQVYSRTAGLSLVESVNYKVNAVGVVLRRGVIPRTDFYSDPHLQSIPLSRGG